ncbi:hypothetical protein FA026_08895 [Escherichia coli]|nr:hypothetical protein FA026_08895 [Escherichia coli]
MPGFFLGIDPLSTGEYGKGGGGGGRKQSYVNSGMNLLCRPRVYLWLLVKASIPCLISTACPSDICYFCDL